MGLKVKLNSLIEKGTLLIHILVMTDLPEGNWTGTYLQDLVNDSSRFKLHLLRDTDELVTKTADKLAKIIDRIKATCQFPLSPDILLYIEESICSCAMLGFVGTTGSTIAESIELMRQNGKCLDRHLNVL